MSQYIFESWASRPVLPGGQSSQLTNAFQKPHISFFSQWRKFKPLAMKHRNKSFGLRINPEHSEGTVPIYDPGVPLSRLGIVRSEFRPEELDGISYLHFHNFCQQNADALARTVLVKEKNSVSSFPK